MSPTINFKNATGSFTYEESAPVPPDPPTPDEIVIPEGKITGFNTANGGSLSIGGIAYFIETPGKAWNMKQVDDRTLRFEVRSGDRFTSEWWSDPTTSERCEVSSKATGALVQPNQTILIQHRILWEPGPKTTSSWSCYSQMHELDVSNSPPYAIGLEADKMVIDVGMNQQQFVFKDTSPIERGRWYTIQTEAKWDKNNGFLKTKRDGQLIVDYKGPLGSGVAHYPKLGIYRHEAQETIAVQYRDWSLKVS
jgi:hypothetical protein